MARLRYVSRFILLAMLAGVVWLLAWQPSPPVPEQRRNDVVVQYWEKWTGVEQDAIQQIVDDFNDTVGKEKHIYVDMLSMSNIDQKTLVATAAGEPPDVAGLWDTKIPQFGELGALTPLDDMAAAHGITAGYYKPVYWRGCHYNGHLYSLVSTPATIALFYNTKIFHENAAELRAAGLDPDRAPRTLHELDRYASVLNTFKIGPDGRKHLDRAGYIPMLPGWYITDMPIWFGADEWDEKTKRFTLTDPGVIAAFNWIQSYSIKLGADAVTEMQTSQGGFNSVENEFIAGTVAMEMQGPWMANYIHHWKPEMDHDWAAAPFPSAVGQKLVTYAPFDALAIPVGAKHKKEAFEFIAYINRQDVMEKLCMLHCKNSPLAKVSNYFLTHHPNPYIRVFEELAWSPNAHITMQCPIASEAGQELLALAQGVVALQLDPETALREAQVRLQARYDDFEAKQKIRQRDR
ncbi:MAG TPA: extracellular solute-binding protein [Tepidisphaeraceae bacterium]|nr:extracellular solute-binding protein [Tepidisphaeraceae bacterium]